MFKKTITYPDLDGNMLTEDFYFHLFTAELAKWELRTKGGLSSYLKQIVAADNNQEIVDAFEEILTKAYGVRNADNKSFEKSPELIQHFMGTEAYSKLFMELVSDEKAMLQFFNGVVPDGFNITSDTDTSVLKGTILQDVSLPEEPKKEIKGPKRPQDMTREELVEAMKTRIAENSKE
jgi:hypothetical protein